jgi:hypothetical protein
MSVTDPADQSISAAVRSPGRLCKRCGALDFFAADFRFEDSISGLEEKSGDCDFCELLFKVCKTRNILADPDSLATFGRIGSNIYMHENLFPPVLSICRSRGE